MRNLDVRIALDDFGAGYSGLSYLRQFDFHRIKIDRSFVTEMLVNPHDLRLVETIIDLCRTLGLHTTAEVIESFEMRNRLMELGCDTGQGFFFRKPKPNAEIVHYLRGSSLAEIAQPERAKPVSSRVPSAPRAAHLITRRARIKN